MKKYFYHTWLVACLLLVFTAQAQQDANYTLYRYNMNLINPAAVGLEQGASLSLGYRSQWVGISGAPNTQVINFRKQTASNMNYGLSIVRDEVFVLQETDIALDLAYQLQLAPSTRLFFGMKGGGSFVNIDLNRAEAPENDPLFSQNESFFNAHIGVGAYLQHDAFYLSVSTPNFLNGKRYVKEGNAPKAAIDNLHLYLGGGYHFKLGSTTLTPSVMLRATEGAPNSIDTGVHVQTQKLGGGCNYRLDESLSFYGVFAISKQLKLGTAYDVTTSKLNQISNKGSLEFIAQYSF